MAGNIEWIATFDKIDLARNLDWRVQWGKELLVVDKQKLWLFLDTLGFKNDERAKAEKGFLAVVESVKTSIGNNGNVNAELRKITAMLLGCTGELADCKKALGMKMELKSTAWTVPLWAGDNTAPQLTAATIATPPVTATKLPWGMRPGNSNPVNNVVAKSGQVIGDSVETALITRLPGLVRKANID